MCRTCALLLACAALLAGGCGGGGERPSAAGEATGAEPAATRLTKAQYVAQANEACRDTARAQQAHARRIDDLQEGDLEGAAPIIADVVERTRDGYARLRALSPPAAQQEQADAYLATVRRLLASLDRITAAARANDRAAGEKATDAGDRLDEAQERLAERLGLDDCKDVF